MKNQDKPISAKFYGKAMLTFYNLWVHGVSNTFAWKVKKADIHDLYAQFYNGNAHLEVAVGTGIFLIDAAESGDDIDLLDVNQSTIDVASNSLNKMNIHANGIIQDVYQDFKLDKKYKSIAMNYLLHCLSGDKKKVLERMKLQLEDDGVVFGSTIINGNKKFSLLGRFLMWLYNKMGVFTNLNDTQEHMTKIITDVFPNAKIKIIGHVLFFSSV